MAWTDWLEKHAASRWRSPQALGAFMRRFAPAFPEPKQLPNVARATLLQHVGSQLKLPNYKPVVDWHEPFSAANSIPVFQRMNAAFKQLPAKKIIGSAPSEDLPTLPAAWLKPGTQPQELYRGSKVLGDPYTGGYALANRVPGNVVHGTPHTGILAEFAPKTSAGFLASRFRAAPEQKYFSDYGIERGAPGIPFSSVRTQPRKSVGVLSLLGLPEWTPRQLAVSSTYETPIVRGQNPFLGYSLVRSSVRRDVPRNSSLEAMLRSAMTPVQHGNFHPSRVDITNGF